MRENSSTPNVSADRKLRILVVEDEFSTLSLLSAGLRSAAHYAYAALEGESARRVSRSIQPDLIVLHLSSAEANGKEVVGRLREWTLMPIVVLSVRHQESEKIECLDAGADDYLTKPFSMRELLARVRAVVRRSCAKLTNEVFTTGALSVDFSKREVFVGDEQIKLTATEYHLLRVLVRHAGLVRTHNQLIHEVWGCTQYHDSIHLLRVTVSNLRRKLVCDSTPLQPILTEPGVGYRLQSVQ